MTTTSTPRGIDETREDLIRRTWSAVASPGSFLTGEERVGIAAAVRSARAGDPVHDPGPAGSAAEDAARTIAIDAPSIRPERVEAWSAALVDPLAYVELVSVVVRVVAMDSYRATLRAPLDPLPEPRPGAPEPVAEPAATISTGWVPTVGQALATTALSALPRESAGVEGVSDVLYLTYEGVADLKHDPGRPITRPQMELIASRTSWLNECFY